MYYNRDVIQKLLQASFCDENDDKTLFEEACSDYSSESNNHLKPSAVKGDLLNYNEL